MEENTDTETQTSQRCLWLTQVPRQVNLCQIVVAPKIKLKYNQS